MAAMRSLAALKRRLPVGASLTMVHFMGGIPPALMGALRKVTTCQSNAIAMGTVLKDGTLGESWLQWPKASCVLFYADNPDKFGICDPGSSSPAMVYVIAKTQEMDS